MFARTPASNQSISSRRLVFEVGINDSAYNVTKMVNGHKLRCPIYAAWANMLARSYDPKYHEIKPTYADVTVCCEWHLFSAFAEWYEINHIAGFELDKDILVSGNKVYSPSTCIFASKSDNVIGSMAKNYNFLDPDGNQHAVYNLSKFCLGN